MVQGWIRLMGPAKVFMGLKGPRVENGLKGPRLNS